MKSSLLTPFKNLVILSFQKYNYFSRFYKLKLLFRNMELISYTLTQICLFSPDLAVAGRARRNQQSSCGEILLVAGSFLVLECQQRALCFAIMNLVLLRNKSRDSSLQSFRTRYSRSLLRVTPTPTCSIFPFAYIFSCSLALAK